MRWVHVLEDRNGDDVDSGAVVDLSSTYLSSVAARMYLPFGENLTKETGGLSSSISVFRHCPDAVSQIRL